MIFLKFAIPMKKSIVIAFLSIYLFSITELNQFLKIPVLVQHYSEHMQKNNKITFWGFICEHYSNKVVNDNDYDKDSKLPFKTLDNCNNSNFVSLLPEQKISINTNVFLSEKKAISKYYARFENSIYLKSIWQPPKFS